MWIISVLTCSYSLENIEYLLCFYATRSFTLGCIVSGMYVCKLNIGCKILSILDTVLTFDMHFPLIKHFQVTLVSPPCDLGHGCGVTQTHLVFLINSDQEDYIKEPILLNQFCHHYRSYFCWCTCYIFPSLSAFHRL